MERTEPTFKNAYLGKRGYTLFKSELDTPALNAIREALTARPFVPKSPQQMPPFKIYRETKDKMFVPRYYGLDTFGPPRRNMIAEGGHDGGRYDGVRGRDARLPVHNCGQVHRGRASAGRRTP